MTPSAASTVLLAGGLLVTGIAGSGCTDSGGGGGAGSSGTTGSGGTTGTAGTTGTGGSGGGGGASGGTGGVTPGFMSIAPCPNESDYMIGRTTVDFGLINGAYAYAPKCLIASLSVGSSGVDITFSGDFLTHPLEPSALRGAQTGNPITPTSAGTSKTFQFTTPGFYAYFCQAHNPSDNGAAMSGVVWVTQQTLLP